ncbi:hypothetical protein [Ferrimonas aestuarii]|uniref:Uncharacterized protein n=1 Tax=Ferrimonas aestuarii TaxID=2569539 RepID=A0A4U1BS45_9GAMM|nr:hypothetical protein [Ferrimonas aestuarii]TKB58453.1 hypothetical protein FCL42_01535 [Ferrimonas aestuarii]
MRIAFAMLIGAVVMVGSPLEAKPYHGHKPHKRVIVVKPGYHHLPYRGHYHYHHRDLAGIATFAVFAGITYAIVDNAYYQKQGDTYVYVERPPAGDYQVVSTTTTVSSGTSASGASQPVNSAVSVSYSIGTVVNAAPVGSREVVVSGVHYRELNGTWFVPVAGSSQFVVVTSPF